MADTYARMKQLIGSTAEWAAHDIILGYGELGIERASATEYRMKSGDGTSKWSLLPYITESASGINAAIQTALSAKLAIAGGTMTGELILAHDGTRPLEAVTLTQLQAEVTKLTSAIGTKLSTAGGTLTGPILMSHDATQSLEPVTLDQMTKALAAVGSATAGGINFKGSIDATVAYVAPVPAPVNGGMYTASKAGPLHASWTAHIDGTPPTNVAVGDQFIWDAAASKFVHVASGAAGGAFVPLAGTAAVTGLIEWSGAAGANNGRPMIDTKGGLISGEIDGGIY